MLSDRAIDALEGIRINIEAVRAFIAGMSQQAFVADRRTLYAVTRALEIISEASRRLPDDLKARHSHVPWRAIRDAGNVYRHRYDAVTAALVWETASNQLAALWDVVAGELDAHRLGRNGDAGADFREPSE